MDEDTKTPSGEPQRLPQVAENDRTGLALLDAGRRESIWWWAKVFAASGIVPDHCKGSPETCAILIHTAQRLGVDEFTFVQHSYVVHNKPGMEAQIVIGRVNHSGLFTPLNWAKTGTEGTDSFGCTCYATRKSTGQKCETTLTWKTVKAEGWDRNPKWHSITEQMFRYRTAAFFARAHCPEVLLGFLTNEELEDMATVETTARPIPPPPVDPDEPQRTKPTSTAETGNPAQTAEGPSSASAPPTESETPSASEMPEAWQTKAKDDPVIGSAEFALFWPRYRQKNGDNKKPAQEWLANHHYSSSKEVRKSDFQQMLKDLTT